MSTKKAFFWRSESGRPTAPDVGLTCLKEAAAGRPMAALSSATICQLLKASRKLMKPGRPDSTSMGSSPPSSMKMRAGFW